MSECQFTVEHFYQPGLESFPDRWIVRVYKDDREVLARYAFTRRGAIRVGSRMARKLEHHGEVVYGERRVAGAESKP